MRYRDSDWGEGERGRWGEREMGRGGDGEQKIQDLRSKSTYRVLGNAP
jgi:hypothetical protein